MRELSGQGGMTLVSEFIAGQIPVIVKVVTKCFTKNK
jgi:hypothetical protein